MPKIVTQSPNHKPVTRKPGSILSRAVSVDMTDSGGIKIGIYGRGKTGKTRLLATFPKKICLIGAEDGTKSIKQIPGIDFFKVILSDKQKPKSGNYVHISELLSLLDEIETSDYLTVGLDNGTSLQEIILAELLGLEEIPVQKSWAMATREQYGQRSQRTKQVLKKLLDLPQHKVIITHEMNHTSEEESTGSDLLMPSIGCALSKSTASWLNGELDYICQTFIREQTVNKASSIAGKTVNIAQSTGKKEFCLRIGPDAIFQTGFRVPPGAELPDLVIDPTYEKILSIMQGKYRSNPK